MKKILSIFISLSIALMMIPSMAFADNSEESYQQAFHQLSGGGLQLLHLQCMGIAGAYLRMETIKARMEPSTPRTPTQ